MSGFSDLSGIIGQVERSRSIAARQIPEIILQGAAQRIQSQQRAVENLGRLKQADRKRVMEGIRNFANTLNDALLAREQSEFRTQLQQREQAFRANESRLSRLSDERVATADRMQRSDDSRATRELRSQDARLAREQAAMQFAANTGLGVTQGALDRASRERIAAIQAGGRNKDPINEFLNESTFRDAQNVLDELVRPEIRGDHLRKVAAGAVARLDNDQVDDRIRERILRAISARGLNLDEARRGFPRKEPTIPTLRSAGNAIVDTTDILVSTTPRFQKAFSPFHPDIMSLELDPVPTQRPLTDAEQIDNSKAVEQMLLRMLLNAPTK